MPLDKTRLRRSGETHGQSWRRVVVLASAVATVGVMFNCAREVEVATDVAWVCKEDDPRIVALCPPDVGSCLSWLCQQEREGVQSTPPQELYVDTPCGRVYCKVDGAVVLDAASPAATTPRFSP